jgi:hypothetical protein
MTSTDEISMRKGWMLYAIAVGIAASLVALLIVTMSFDMAHRQSQLFNLLYGMGGDARLIPPENYEVSNGIFGLLMIGMLLLELAGGMLAWLLARGADNKKDGNLMASLVAGLLPAALFGIFYFNSWLASLSENHSLSSARPSEPAVPGAAILIILVLMTICLASAITGGIMAQYALKREANDKKCP